MSRAQGRIEDRRPRPLPKPFSRMQVRLLLRAPNTHTIGGLRLRTMLETLLRTGLRRTELALLRLEDLDLERAYLTVIHGKGNKSRVVPIQPELSAWYDAWLPRRETRLREMGLPPSADPGWLFPAMIKGGTPPGTVPRCVGNHIHPNTVGMMVGELGRKLGVSPCHPHRFRHTFATWLMESGEFSLVEVQQLMGHSNLETTAIYIHANPLLQRAKFLTMGKKFFEAGDASDEFWSLGTEAQVALQAEADEMLRAPFQGEMSNLTALEGDAEETAQLLVLVTQQERFARRAGRTDEAARLRKLSRKLQALDV